MTLNGKRDNFVRGDFRAVALGATMKRGRADEILDDVIATVARWDEFAEAANVDPAQAGQIASAHRLTFSDT